MFGANLCSLAKGYPSISELSRQLGINCTQFNRYLSGQSFPHPDVLARICALFDIDARVLLEPVHRIQSMPDLISGNFITDFVGTGTQNLSTETFPNGFCKFSRRNFLEADQFLQGLAYVKRSKGNTFISGYEAKAAMGAQGLNETYRARELKELILQQEEGFAAFISRHNSIISSFNYLHGVTSFENNFWVGYATRTVREPMMGDPVIRPIFEHLGHDSGKACEATTNTGYCSVSGLNAFHRRLLQPDDPFRQSPNPSVSYAGKSGRCCTSSAPTIFLA